MDQDFEKLKKKIDARNTKDKVNNAMGKVVAHASRKVVIELANVFHYMVVGEPALQPSGPHQPEPAPSPRDGDYRSYEFKSSTQYNQNGTIKSMLTPSEMVLEMKDFVDGEVFAMRVLDD